MSDCPNHTFLKQNKSMSEEEDASDASEESNSEMLRLTRQDSITFVTIGGITQLIKQKCKEIREILKINDDEALILLDYYKWSIELLQNDWLKDQEKLRKKAGIGSSKALLANNSSEAMCLVCSGIKSRQEFDSMKCNHLICKNCWIDYIHSNVTRPKNAFFWRCPVKGCHLVIPNSFNQKYITDDQRIQYEKRKIMTYTHNSNTFKWCPIPTCQYGVDITEKKVHVIECLCGYVYCNKCKREDHRPLTCQLATDWLETCTGNIKLRIRETVSYINNFQRCEGEMKRIEELSKRLKLGKPHDSNDLNNVIQGACNTLRDTKRLEKWSYAYTSFLSSNFDGKLLRFKLEIQQENFAKCTKELEKLLQEVNSLRSESCRKSIQSVESKCKKTSAILLDKVATKIIDKVATKIIEPQNHLTGKILDWLNMLLYFYIVYLVFAQMLWFYFFRHMK